MSNRRIFTFTAILFCLIFLAGCTLFGPATPTATPATPATAPGTGNIAPGGTTPGKAMNTDGAETKLIPAGVYLLGSPATDLLALPPEKPQHKVDLSGFYIYTHEVTNAMYKKCADAGTCLPVTAIRQDLVDYYGNDTYKEFPVIGADWNMAKAYCEWAGGRLPTEAEWEAAARGVDERIYPWGNDPATCELAGMKGCNSVNLPFQAGSFAKGNSPYELWDMAGNVWEWVNDWFDANFYATDPSVNPVGPWGSDFKVVRGGGWNSTNSTLRSAMRLAVNPLLSFRDVGFRCVANPFAVNPGISLPDPGHARRAGDGTSVEDGGGETPLRTLYFGSPLATCSSPDTILFQVAANNSFGGSYTAELDGRGMSCSYAGGYLTCRTPRVPPATNMLGTMIYNFEVTITDPSGTRLPPSSGGLSVVFPGNQFDRCAGTTSPLILHTASATCLAGAAGRQVSVIVNVAAHFNQVLVNDSLLSGCFASAANSITCPLPSSLAPGSATVHAIGTSADGVDTLDFTDPVTIPDCSALGSGYPAVTLGAVCTAPGRYTIDIRITPVTIPIARVISGSGRLSCTLLEPGHLSCPAGLADLVPGPSGDILPVVLSFEPPLDFGTGTSTLGAIVDSVAVGTCTRSETSGGLDVGPVVCSPTGAGFLARVNTDPLAAYTAVSWQSGTERHVCAADPSTPNRWGCQLPSVVPADINICGGNGSGTACYPHPEILSALPARCGGSPNDPTEWNLSLRCDTAMLYSVVGDVILTTPNTILGVSLHFAGTTTGLMPDPFATNAFRFYENLPLASGDREFCATFVGGANECHSFTRDDVAAAAPASCGGTASGEWSMSLNCTPERASSFPPGWVEYRVQYPSTLTLDLYGEVAGHANGCYYINNATGHYLNYICPPTRPAIPIWVLARDTTGIVYAKMFEVSTPPAEACPTAANMNLKPAGRCEGTQAFVDFYGNAGDVITLNSLNGAPIPAGDISHSGAALVTCAVPASTQGTTANFGFNFQPAGGSAIPAVLPVMIPECPTSSPGGSGTLVQCIGGHILITLNTEGLPLTVIEIEGSPVNPADCSGNGTSSVSCFFPDSVQTTGWATGALSYVDETGITQTPVFYIGSIPNCNARPDLNLTQTCDATNSDIYVTLVLPAGWSYDSISTGGGSWTSELLPDGRLHLHGPTLLGMGHLVGSIYLHQPGTSFPFTLPFSITVPPCGNSQDVPGWGLNAHCNPSSPDIIELTMTYPTVLGIFPAVINTVPGWSCVMPDLSGNSINCTFPLSLRGSGPLTWQFTGPAPDHASIPHTFTDYDTVVPRFCGPTPMPPTAGWSLNNIACTNAGGHVEFNVNHTVPPDVSSAFAQSGSVSYGCGIVNPSSLYCAGPLAFGPLSSLLLNYTVTDGTTGSVSFDDWPSRAPNYCPTPQPQTGGQTGCSQYTNSNTCGSALCSWWWGNSTCHSNPDPCDGTDKLKCLATPSCAWNGSSCYTP